MITLSDHLVTYNNPMGDTNNVFKALSDKSRRLLLDRLFQQDGQTLSELEAHLDMTRFGVMKHLRILEEANLITTEKIGSEKHHYLNAVPIQLVYDRWVNKYARRWAEPLADLKYQLENETMSNTPDNIYQIFIQTTPEKLWNALIDGDMTQKYYFGTRVESEWRAGAPYTYKYENGEDMVKGEVIEVEPPKKLVTTFQPIFAGPEAGTSISRVTFEIEDLGDTCRLKLTHEDLDPEQPLTAGIMEGWAKIFSSLKTVLEVEQTLVIAA